MILRRAIKHFRDLKFDKSATPLDYEAIVADPYFMNIATYRRQAMRKGPLPVFEATLKDINSLITMIESKLGDTELGNTK